MTSEPVRFGLLEDIDVIVEDEPYRLNLNISAALHARIFRWWQQLPDLADAVADRQAIEYLDGLVIGASTETIAAWRSMTRKGLLAFLSNQIPDKPPAVKPTMTPSSSERSSSREVSTVA